MYMCFSLTHMYIYIFLCFNIVFILKFLCYFPHTHTTFKENIRTTIPYTRNIRYFTHTHNI